MRPLLSRRCRFTKLALIAAFILLSISEVTKVRHCLIEPTIEPITRRSERIYIASLHWNNEPILRSYWNDAVLALAKALGRENVFVAIHESGSWDDSKGALRELDLALDELGVRRNIAVSNVTHLDEISAAGKGGGWIDTPRGQKELRRIPYLSQLRNSNLEPLQQLARHRETFDKVLFLNDVVFTVADVFRLLDTNSGDFAAACALDFERPPQVYDTFALRDAEGHEILTQTWPYFRSRKSRQAMQVNGPAPVVSCWNGMVAMPAEPFVSNPPLRFRGLSDSLATLHLEGSECCLIHIDSPLRDTKQVFVNPQVRVGYSGDAYAAVQQQEFLLSPWQIYKALWWNRLCRWLTSPWLREWRIKRRLGKQSGEAGRACIVREMQVLQQNGWAHILEP